MQNLYDNMAQHGLDIRRIPFVIQYNKRDLPNAAALPQLQEALNPGWAVEDPVRQRVVPDPNRPGETLVQEVDGMWVERVSSFEACALRGDGVFDTLRAISKLVLKTIG
jgi:signal recognition particle receptor subunit beta